jgi:hypothetical protein
MPAYSYQVQNGGAVINSLKKKIEAGLRPALEKTKEVIEAKFKSNPSDWKPLAQFTIFERRRLGFGPTPILFRTGRLQSASVQEVAVDSPTEGHVSTSDPEAIKQNNGEGRIPARPFYKLSDADRAMILDTFLAGMKNA